MNRRADLAHGPFNFRVTGVADENQRAALARRNACPGRALWKPADRSRRAPGSSRRSASRTIACGTPWALKTVTAPCGHLVQFLDKSRAFSLQRLDHVAVVHDLVAHIDGPAIFLERVLDDVDRPHHAGAKPTRLGKNDAHHRGQSFLLPLHRQRPLTYCEMM